MLRLLPDIISHRESKSRLIRSISWILYMSCNSAIASILLHNSTIRVLRATSLKLYARWLKPIKRRTATILAARCFILLSRLQ